MIGTLMNNGRTCVLKENGGSKKIPVHPEQYVYVQVSNAWIPAILKYSGERQNWYFEYLPKLPEYFSMAGIHALETCTYTYCSG